MDKKYYYIGAGVLVAVIIAIIIYKNRKPNTDVVSELGINVDTSTDEQKKARALSDQSFPLKFGSTGESVRQLQLHVISLGGQFPKFGADGKWGAETEEQVLKFMGSNTISKDLFISKNIYLLG